MVDDPKWHKDKAGPRGFERCWVKTADRLGNIEQVLKRRRVEQEERLNKKATPEQLAAKVRVALDGGASSFSDGMAAFSSSDAQSQHAVFKGLSNSDGAGEAFSSFVEPDFDELMAASGKKRKVDEEEEEKEDETKDPSAEEPEKRPKVGWFDADTKVNAAQRRYEKGCEKIRAALSSTAAKMVETLQAVATEHKAKLKAEIVVVTRRHSWVNAVLADDGGKSLRSTIESTKSVQAQAQTSPSDGASTSTQSQLMNAGPCAGWEDLVTMCSVEQQKHLLKSATSNEELKEKECMSDGSKKLLGILMASCKSALGDLTSAQAAIKTDEDLKAKAVAEAAVQDRDSRSSEGCCKHPTLSPTSSNLYRQGAQRPSFDSSEENGLRPALCLFSLRKLCVICSFWFCFGLVDCHSPPSRIFCLFIPGVVCSLFPLSLSSHSRSDTRGTCANEDVSSTAV
jgi:hypothetical protein